MPSSGAVGPRPPQRKPPTPHHRHHHYHHRHARLFRRGDEEDFCLRKSGEVEGPRRGCRRKPQRCASLLQHHFNHRPRRAAERPEERGVACVPGSSSLSLQNHRYPTSCVAAFAPKLRRQAFCFVLFLSFLVF